MDSECARLDEARRAVAKGGLTRANKNALFHAAHDIKGEAATLGHPLVEGVAKNLCRLIEHTRDQAGIPVVLIDQHVDAILAIVRAPTNFAAARLAGRLTSELTRVTAEYLIREDMSALGTDYRVDSPPLAPDSATR